MHWGWGGRHGLSSLMQADDRPATEEVFPITVLLGSSVAGLSSSCLPEQGYGGVQQRLTSPRQAGQ